MLPPNVDKFSEDLASRPVITILDFLSRYDQITLDKRYRDFIAF